MANHVARHVKQSNHEKMIKKMTGLPRNYIQPDHVAERIANIFYGNVR